MKSFLKACKLLEKYLCKALEIHHEKQMSSASFAPSSFFDLFRTLGLGLLSVSSLLQLLLYMFVFGLSVLVLSMNVWVRVRVRVGAWGARSGFEGSTPTTALIKMAINNMLPAGVAARRAAAAPQNLPPASC